MSSDFPVTPGSFRTSYTAIAYSENILSLVYIAKLNPSGSALVYATFLGASRGDGSGQNAIAVDPSGNAYIAGQTQGSQFPLAGNPFLLYNPWPGTSGLAGYLSILSADGSTLKYSSYWVPATGLAMDGNGYVYLTGFAVGDYGHVVVTAARIQAAPPQPPSLKIAKSHTGNFYQGQNAATYTVIVGNAASAGSTNGLVTVTESVPSGMTLVSMDGGPAWNCTALPSCTTTNVLNGGAIFQPITVTVNVSSNAGSPQVNTVSVSGGGSPTVNSVDSTVIVVPVTIQTNPVGLLFSIDGGMPQVAPRILNLSSGTHTIAVPTPQAGPAGSQYLFTGWSDTGAVSHTIEVSGAAATYTASFKTQYQLIIAALPPVGGIMSPSSGTFFDPGTTVIVTYTPVAPFVFTSWSGNLTGTSNPASVTMDAAKTVNGNFAVPGFTCDLNGDGVVNVIDVQFIIDEALGTSPPTIDLNGDNLVNVVDVQIEINAALGLGCTAKR